SFDCNIDARNFLKAYFEIPDAVSSKKRVPISEITNQQIGPKIYRSINTSASNPSSTFSFSLKLFVFVCKGATSSPVFLSSQHSFNARKTAGAKEYTFGHAGGYKMTQVRATAPPSFVENCLQGVTLHVSPRDPVRTPPGFPFSQE